MNLIIWSIANHIPKIDHKKVVFSIFELKYHDSRCINQMFSTTNVSDDT